MDFRNKYLKYKPEITFDIFQKVWDKLIESGYLPVGKYDVERGFGDFKTLHCYLRTTDSHPMEFNCYSVIPALFWVETTVQEILGYDPFVMGDDFVLPEKWYVEVTTENKNVLNDWKIKQQFPLSLYSFDYEFIVENGGGYIYEESIKDRVKITFGQFKKYVLKQDVEESTKIDYYRCIKADFPELVLGKIYPSYDSKWVKIPNGEYTSCFDVGVYRFEPSTKSAFDAQNQPKQPIKQAVHCETQEQWDFVIEKIGYKNLQRNLFNNYKTDSCIILNSCNHYGHLKWATKENYQILSFSDWYAQSNYDFLSTEDKYKEVLRKKCKNPWWRSSRNELSRLCSIIKTMFDFNVSEQAVNTVNSISDTIDRDRYRAMQIAQTETLDEMFCASIDEVSKSLDNYTNKNKVKISTDNEIKINIIQKQSIKI